MTLRVSVLKNDVVICSIARPGVLSIGTESYNDLVLPREAPGIDFRLTYQRRGPTLWLKSEGSEELIKEAGERPLPYTDRISVGPYRFEHQDLRHPQRSASKTGTRLIRLDGHSMEVQSISLQVTDGPDKGLTIPITGHTLVGASDDCGLRLTDPYVSGSHCEVFPSDKGLVVRDLGSKNGTRVSGVSISVGEAPQGSSIEVGQTTIGVIAEINKSDLEPEEDDIFCGMAGVSDSMRRIFALIKRLAPEDVPVLLSGPTGVGKELAARALHELSPRSKAPFIAVNCAALSPQIFESELFGHVKGAFTGAARSRPGMFAAADGGSLLLDEIGELPDALQAKLLRALEDNAVVPVGSETSVPVDVRIIAATNRDLEAEVAAKNFREDLYYRLSVFPISIPSLENRPEDIPIIAKTLLLETAPGKSISPEALSKLQERFWPGNVREMRNVLSRSAILAGSDNISVDDVTRAFLPALDSHASGSTDTGRTLVQMEKETIAAELSRCGGNRSKAAKALGIAKSTLYEKLKKYGISEDD